MGGGESRICPTIPNPDLLQVVTLSESAVQRLPLDVDDNPLDKERSLVLAHSQLRTFICSFSCICFKTDRGQFISAYTENNYTKIVQILYCSNIYDIRHKYRNSLRKDFGLVWNQNIDDYWLERVKCLDDSFYSAKGLTDSEFERLEKEIIKMAPGVGKIRCEDEVREVAASFRSRKSDFTACKEDVQRLELCLDKLLANSMKKSYQEEVKRLKEDKKRREMEKRARRCRIVGT